MMTKRLKIGMSCMRVEWWVNRIMRVYCVRSDGHAATAQVIVDEAVVTTSVSRPNVLEDNDDDDDDEDVDDKHADPDAVAADTVDRGAQSSDDEQSDVDERERRKKVSVLCACLSCCVPTLYPQRAELRAFFADGKQAPPSLPLLDEHR
jgi:hypothetical protein